MRFTLEPFGEIDIIRSSEGVMHLGHSLNGHRRVLPLNSQEAENYINLVFVEKNIVPTKGEINKTITMLKALSLKVKDTEAINYRYAHLDDNIYINLGDGNHAIRIPKKGEIKPVKNPKAIFTSLEHFEDLNYDRTAKPDFDLLWKYAPPLDEGDKLLLTTLKVSSCFPHYDHPIGLLIGPSGSGKTTLADIFTQILDPSSLGVSAPIASVEDIRLNLANRYVTAFDNNSGIFSRKVQDLLCLTSTGGKISCRELYTNNRALATNLRRIVIITALHSPFSQDDVLNRLLHFKLKPLSNADYAKVGGKIEFNNNFKSDLPNILNGFYLILQQVFAQLDKMKFPAELPRMIDFARIGITLEKVLKLEKGAFLNAYERNLNFGLSAILEDSTLAQAMILLAKTLREAQTYTRMELIEELEKLSHSPGAIPKESRAFKIELDRVEIALFKLHGIEIKHLTKSKKGERVMVTPSRKKS